MGEKTLLLGILEDGLKETITEWLRSPTEYLYEKDIQALLYGKLRQLLEQKERWSYAHRIYDNSAWKEQQPMALVGCEHSLARSKPDVVLWDPTYQGRNYLDRRALAVVELKCTFPINGAYNETEWNLSKRCEDYDKVRRLVQSGHADWGLALVFCVLPSRAEAMKFFSSGLTAFERDPELKAVRFRIMSYGQVPDFHLI